MSNVFATLRLLAALARALPEKRTDCLAAAAWIGALSSSWSSTDAAEAGLDGDGARLVVYHAQRESLELLL